MKIKQLQLSKEERRTYNIHLTYSFIEGIIAGVLVLNEFVFITSLNGSNFQLAFLFQFSVATLIFSIFFNELQKRVNKKKMLRLIAIVTRVPLFLLILFPGGPEVVTGNSVYHYIFLAIFMIYFLANPIIFPAINLFLKTNYKHENFGPLYSKASRLNKIVVIVATLFFGVLLDINNYVFVYVYPILGLLGIISIFLLANIKYEDKEIKPEKAGYMFSITESLKKIVGIIRINTPYRHYEIGFMFYGFAFMASVSVITIYFKDILNLNYSSVALYKNAPTLIAIIILPFFGKLITNIDPRKFAAISFLSMLLYILFLSITEFFPSFTQLELEIPRIVFFGHQILEADIISFKIYYMLMPFILFSGFFSATMVLMWYIGSAYFCKKEEAGDYQAIHVSLTGVRGMFAPLLGIVFYELFGFFWTFFITMSSLLIGILIMIWSSGSRKNTLINDI